MKRTAILLLLFLLAGCAAPAAPPSEEDPAPPAAEAADPIPITLPIGWRLPLPVTAESLREAYASLGGPGRQVLDIRELNGDFLVWSVSKPYRDTGGPPDEDTRFDYVYGDSGCCYALLEGRYTMDDVTFADRGGIHLETVGDQLAAYIPLDVYTGLNWSLADLNTGEPASWRDLTCISQVRSDPRGFQLAEGPLAALGGRNTGGAAPAAVESVLTGAFLGADTLELVFDTSRTDAAPLTELSYAAAGRELTILCRDTSLECVPSGGNLFVEAVRAEARGPDAAVICTLTAAPEEILRPQEADSVQPSWEFSPGRDWNVGVLRLTFRPFMG